MIKINKILGLGLLVAMIFGQFSQFSSKTLLAQTSTASFPTSRDPYQWPFSKDSIWNMPLANTAQYEPMDIKGYLSNLDRPGIDTNDQQLHIGIDTNYVVRATLKDPIKEVYQTWNGGTDPKRCSGNKPTVEWNGSTNSPYNIQIPDSFLTSPVANEPGENASAVIIESDLDIKQFNYFARCSTGGDVYGVPLQNFTNPGLGKGIDGYATYVADQNLKGKGIYGGHGGSGLSALGGNLTVEDVTSDQPIRHALNFDLPGYYLYGIGSGDLSKSIDYQNEEIFYRWPAVVRDGVAQITGAYGYHGVIPDAKMGALFAINPNLDINTLDIKTPVAKKIFQAFKDYGGYVVDNTGWNSIDINVDHEVPDAFEAKYGYRINPGKPSAPWYDARGADYYADMVKIYSSLNVVKNSAENTPGGGAYDGTSNNRRTSLAPCFVGDVNCNTSSSSFISSTNSSSSVSVIPVSSSSMNSSSLSSSISDSSECTILGIHPSSGSMQDWAKLDKLNQLESWQGKKNANITIYVASVSRDLDYAFNELETTWNRGSIPNLSLEFWANSYNTDNPDNSTIETRIAQGELDGYFTDFRTRLINYIDGDDNQLNTSDDRRLYLRPAHEANGNWYGWSGTPDDYIKAWRRMYSIVNPEFSKSQLQWIWSVNNTDQGGISAESYYPGDAYVDWLGIDGYNWGKSFDWGEWNSPSLVFDNMLNRLRVLSPNKPISINEVSSTSVPNGVEAKNNWIASMFEYVHINNIKMLNWFNEDKETDWAIFGGKLGNSIYQNQSAYSKYALSVGDNRVIGSDSSNPKILSDTQFSGSQICISSQAVSSVNASSLANSSQASSQIPSSVFVSSANSSALISSEVSSQNLSSQTISSQTNSNPTILTLGTTNEIVTGTIGLTDMGNITLVGNTYPNDTVANFVPSGSAILIIGKIKVVFGVSKFVADARQIIPTDSIIGSQTGVLKVGLENLNVTTNFVTQASSVISSQIISSQTVSSLSSLVSSALASSAINSSTTDSASNQVSSASQNISSAVVSSQASSLMPSSKTNSSQVISSRIASSTNSSVSLPNSSSQTASSTQVSVANSSTTSFDVQSSKSPVLSVNSSVNSSVANSSLVNSVASSLVSVPVSTSISSANSSFAKIKSKNLEINKNKVSVFINNDCDNFDSLDEYKETSGDYYIQFKTKCLKIEVKTVWENLDTTKKYKFVKYNPNTQTIAGFEAKIVIENGKITTYHTIQDGQSGDYDSVVGQIWDPYTLVEEKPEIIPSEIAVSSPNNLQSINLISVSDSPKASKITPSVLNTPRSGDEGNSQNYYWLIILPLISYLVFAGNKLRKKFLK